MNFTVVDDGKVTKKSQHVTEPDDAGEGDPLANIPARKQPKVLAAPSVRRLSHEHKVSGALGVFV